MNFNENDLWRNKTELLNFRPSKLPIAKVLLKLEFDTEDQVLFHTKDILPKIWLTTTLVHTALYTHNLSFIPCLISNDGLRFLIWKVSNPARLIHSSSQHHACGELLHNNTTGVAH